MDPPSSLGFAAVGAAGAGEARGGGGDSWCEAERIPERIPMVTGLPALTEGPLLFFQFFPFGSPVGFTSRQRVWREEREI